MAAYFGISAISRKTKASGDYQVIKTDCPHTSGEGGA
jgi:hypothetical protein